MDHTFLGPCDIGLSLRSLPCLYEGSTGFCRSVRKEAWVLPCGHLLRAGAGSKYCHGNEEVSAIVGSSREPRAIITFTSEGAEGSKTNLTIERRLPGRKGADATHNVTCEGSLCQNIASDAKSTTWLMELLRLLDCSEVPILLCSDLACAGFVDLAVLTLLKVLGAPDDVAAVARLVRPDVSLQDISSSHDAALQALETFTVAGGIDNFCGINCDLAVLRQALQGSTASASIASSKSSTSAVQFEQWQSADGAWLKNDIKLTFKLARQAEEKEKEHPSQMTGAANFWYKEVALAAESLSDISPPSEAAPAQFYRGSALARLVARADGGAPALTSEARQALELGAALAGAGRAKRAVVQQLTRALAELPPPCEADPCIVDANDAANAADPARPLLILDLAGSDASGGLQQIPPKSAESVPRLWHLLPAPRRFAWAIYAPPETLLAVSATPAPLEFPALQALGLMQQIQADAPRGKEQPKVEQVVAQLGQALKESKGCLLHCADGGRASALALACLICKHGLCSAQDWNAEQAAAHTAEEAVDLAGGLRAVEVAEAEVQFFEQALWAEHLMSKIGGASAVEGSEDAAPGKLLTKARVVKQPGDGNCLFHSMGFGLGDSASSLRKRIVAYMKDNPELDISGTSLSDWVQMTAQTSVANYAQKMSRQGEWGGAPEIAVCARMAGVGVNVYQPCGCDFELIATFSGGVKAVAGRAVNVLYVGRMHYDALDVD